MYICCFRIHEMNLQDENDLDWQVMASNWSRSVFSTFYTLNVINYLVMSYNEVLIPSLLQFCSLQASVPLSGLEASGGR